MGFLHTFVYPWVILMPVQNCLSILKRKSSNCWLYAEIFCLPTCSRSLSWWPIMADAWWGYFCFRCSRKASLFLSMSGGCILRISREPRAPPNVCLRGTVRLPLASPFGGAVPFGDGCRRLRCSVSSGDVTFRLLLVCSDGREGQRVKTCFLLLWNFGELFN